MSYDNALLLDWAYASYTLNGQQKHAFRTLYEAVRDEVRKPDLLIVLTCDTAAQIERIRKRGRSFEAGVTPEYLQGLSDALNKAVADEPGYARKILHIDTTDLDLNHEDHRTQVVNQILAALDKPSFGFTLPDGPSL